MNYPIVCTFLLPGAVLILLLLGLLDVPYILSAATIIGIAVIVFDSYRELRKGNYSLDYIAFLAMVVSLVFGQHLAGAIVALMFTGGKALEAFASQKACAALKSFGETIPKRALVRHGDEYIETPLQEIQNGEEILIKHGELVPLDGTLLSEGGVLNLANLTGESEPMQCKTGTFVKSGAVNAGDTIELRVVGDFSSSTYRKIVTLVDEARANPARIVRLSERANVYFTAVTLALAGAAYFWGDATRALAALVIATPCPLIIAAPIAFIGGMSRTARSGIIVRRPAAFEGLAASSTVFFDKTGTLTLGEPTLTEIEVIDQSLSQAEALCIAAGIEIHSLHPLARTIVREATQRDLAFPVAALPAEKLGKSITGTIDGVSYTIAGYDRPAKGIVLVLQREDTPVAYLRFTDVLKGGVRQLFESLKKQKIRTAIITGDTKENADEVLGGLGVAVYADTTPEEKHRIVKDARGNGEIVTMIGDGLNDAPALALAHVGVVFSGTENAASIEAADVVMLDHRIERLCELFAISKRTVGIARQSIYAGIALSAAGMLFALAGYLTPIAGALLQEGIDIVVILNALRTIRSGHRE